jgi:alcohol dehydrogenase
MSRITASGRTVYHYSGVSSFAEYAVTVPGNLVRIEKSYPLDIAAMFGCAVVTGAGSIFNSARLSPGQSVAVFGLGGVGLNAVMAARIVGASKVIGIDLNPSKLELARELGCTHTMLASDADLISAVKDLTDGGVDFAIEMSGSKAAMDTAIEVTCKGGEIICVGVAATSARYFYSHNKLITEEKVIRGSHLGSGRPEHDIPRYLEFFAAGSLPVNRLLSDTIGLEDLNLALDRLHGGAAVRQVVRPNGIAD